MLWSVQTLFCAFHGAVSSLKQLLKWSFFVWWLLLHDSRHVFTLLLVVIGCLEIVVVVWGARDRCSVHSSIERTVLILFSLRRTVQIGVSSIVSFRIAKSVRFITKIVKLVCLFKTNGFFLWFSFWRSNTHFGCCLSWLFQNAFGCFFRHRSRQFLLIYQLVVFFRESGPCLLLIIFRKFAMSLVD